MCVSVYICTHTHINIFNYIHIMYPSLQDDPTDILGWLEATNRRRCFFWILMLSLLNELFYTDFGITLKHIETQ
jgi:hypothetical protein